MAFSLSPENESFVKSKVASGAFTSEQDAIDAGIDLLRKREALQLRIQESRRQLDAGEFTDYSEGSLNKRFLELKQRAKNAKK